MENKILVVNDQPQTAELKEQFGVEAGVKRARHNPALMCAILAYGLMNELDNKNTFFFENYNLSGGVPNIRTYGSKAVKSFSPDEWKQQKREQGRNEPCNCGSGKKYKRCCALSV